MAWSIPVTPGCAEPGGQGAPSVSPGLMAGMGGMAVGLGDAQTQPWGGRFCRINQTGPQWVTSWEPVTSKPAAGAVQGGKVRMELQQGMAGWGEESPRRVLSPNSSGKLSHQDFIEHPLALSFHSNSIYKMMKNELTLVVFLASPTVSQTFQMLKDCSCSTVLT